MTYTIFPCSFIGRTATRPQWPASTLHVRPFFGPAAPRRSVLPRAGS